VRNPVSVAGDAAAGKPPVVDDRTKPTALGDLGVALGPAVIVGGGGGTTLEFVVERRARAPAEPGDLHANHPQ